MAASKARLLRLLGGLGVLLALGFGYVWVIRLLGRVLYCPFYMATGLLCPGCGVSRMCLALLRGDWAGAWRANPFLVILLPILAVLLGLRAVRYVRMGERKGSVWENRAWTAVAILLVGYGVFRNLSSLS